MSVLELVLTFLYCQFDAMYDLPDDLLLTLAHILLFGAHCPRSFTHLRRCHFQSTFIRPAPQTTMTSLSTAPN
jgi:hypothetical protein